VAYGNRPWVQKSWDERAAGNFIFGGAGAGLLVFNALAAAQSQAWRGLWLVGLALVACGLLLVWAEIGRPWRALNVFMNPGTSWMTREAYAATVLLGMGLLVVAGVRSGVPVVALAALAFVYSQGRILRASRGIVAWREPETVSLIVLTALAEGGGLFVAFKAAAGEAPGWALPVLAAMLLLRTGWAAWWRKRLQAAWAPRPDAALRKLAAPLGGRVALWALVLLAAAATLPPGPLARWALALGGLAACGSGAWFKLGLITQAAYNQGFALTKLPVRGVRRGPNPV
jgi:phenylacetyl-CoA:acceptor oxidoreductase subunit 2